MASLAFLPSSDLPPSGLRTAEARTGSAKCSSTSPSILSRSLIKASHRVAASVQFGGGMYREHNKPKTPFAGGFPRDSSPASSLRARRSLSPRQDVRRASRCAYPDAVYSQENELPSSLLLGSTLDLKPRVVSAVCAASASAFGMLSSSGVPPTCDDGRPSSACIALAKSGIGRTPRRAFQLTKDWNNTLNSLLISYLLCIYDGQKIQL